MVTTAQITSALRAGPMTLDQFEARFGVPMGYRIERALKRRHIEQTENGEGDVAYQLTAAARRTLRPRREATELT